MPVNLDHRHHERGGRGDKGLIRPLRLGDGKAALLHLHLRLAGKAQNGRAGDTAQNLVAEVAGDDGVALDDIGVVRSALGHHTILDHPGVIDTGGLGHHLAHGRIKQLNGLDVAAAPTLVRDGHNADALRGSRTKGQTGL